LWEVRSNLPYGRIARVIFCADEVNAAAIKHVLAWQIGREMKAQGISKAEVARRMGTSRAHLDRLLDPRNDKVQLDTVQRAASAIGRKLRVELA